ncbi:hypothetical protein [uncultured Mediterranean phage uvDeep-CGR2-KM21-C345]|nr:hypothetical protein [uncultured Mediterranean phage uvDeep-CGR2-KM21-C345]
MEKVKTKTKREQLNELYLSCGLVKEDVFKHKHYEIITLNGIEKIADIKNIIVKYEVVKSEAQFASVKAIGTMGDITIETFGSASPNNSTNNYYLEMAEKRALSRIVLKLSKAYCLGVKGEEEADVFKKAGNVRRINKPQYNNTISKKFEEKQVDEDCEEYYENKF